MSWPNPSERAGIAAVLTLARAVVMMVAPPRYPFPHTFHHDVYSPVLALELSRDASDIDAVLHRSEPDRVAQAAPSVFVNTVLDLVFIPIYSFFLWSLARVFTSHTRLLTPIVIGTALFDYLENWQIFRALNGASPPIYVPSLVKWGLLGLVLLLTGVILFRSASPVYSEATRGLLALGYIASGGLIETAIALGQRIGFSALELALEICTVLVVIQAIGMLGRHLSIPGTSPEFVENFCEERKRAGKESLIAVSPTERK